MHLTWNGPGNEYFPGVHGYQSVTAFVWYETDANRYYTGELAIDRLIDFVDRHDLRFSVEEQGADGLPGWVRLVRISGRNIDVAVPLDDEYDDFRRDNDPCALNAFLMSLAEYEEAGDETAWWASNSTNDPSSEMLDLARRLPEASKALREAEGEALPDHLAPLHWQLDSDEAYRLRNLPVEFRKPYLYPQSVEAWANPTSLFRPSFLVSFASGKNVVEHWNGDFFEQVPHGNRGDALSALEKSGLKRVEAEISGMAEVDGVLIPTGETFEYWLQEGGQGRRYLAVSDSFGEKLTVQEFGAPGLIEFDSYEQMKLYLWDEGFRLLHTLD